MPQILEMKEIDDEVWVRVGVPGDFLLGVRLLTPDEQNSLWNEAIEAAAEIPVEQATKGPIYSWNVAAAIRKLKKL